MFKKFALAAALAASVASGASAADVVVSSKIDTEGTLLGNIIFSPHSTPTASRRRTALRSARRPFCARRSPQVKSISMPNIPATPASSSTNQTIRPGRTCSRGYDLAKKLDYDANKIVWLTPSPANNTWAIGVRNDVAGPAKLKTMSDFGKWVAGGGPAKLAASSEFVNSPAALPAFQTTHSFQIKPDQEVSASPAATPQRQSRLRPTRPTASTPPWSTAPTAPSRRLN